MTRNAPASRPQWALVLAVFLAHGAALWAWGRPSLPGSHRTHSREAVIQVHMVPVGSFWNAARPATGASLEAEPMAPPPAPVAEPPVLRHAPLIEESARELVPGSQETALDEYLPRHRLSVAPEVLTNVDVQFPPDVNGIVHLKTQITLFVDEQGAVRRLRFDSAGIPSPFAASVLDTFLKARFKPGEVDGVAVRSQIRLEVEFQANRGSQG